MLYKLKNNGYTGTIILDAQNPDEAMYLSQVFGKFYCITQKYPSMNEKTALMIAKKTDCPKRFKIKSCKMIKKD